MIGSLDAVWEWYEGVVQTATAVRHIVDVWDTLVEQGLPPEGAQRLPGGTQLDAAATAALDRLDDIAVVLLFAAFEPLVRGHVVAQIESERAVFTPSHPLLVAAMATLDKRVHQGDISELLRSYAAGADAKLKELLADVKEVREYRNWVAHGRHGVLPIGQPMTAKVAKDRLEEFLFTIRAYPTT